MTSRTIPLKTDSLQDQIRTASLLEVAARKAGNVHPGASFADLRFEDFEVAADVTSRSLSRVQEDGVGQAILNAMTETQRTLQSNANLGIALLLAPLAAVPAESDLVSEIGWIIDSLNMDDTSRIYEAIRLSEPGGLGEVSEQDISQPPGQPIQYAMTLAAERDAIARQYCNEFSDVLIFGRGRFLEWFQQHKDWEVATIGTHLELMVQLPDSLIARKCGATIANESARRAQQVLNQKWPKQPQGAAAFQEFDDWLRADGNRRNPGTTADLIAAVLFSLIRDQQWVPPESITIELSLPPSSSTPPSST